MKMVPKMVSLLKPMSLGSLVLKNRMVLAPLTRARAGPTRVPNDIMRVYYEQRAGAGLLITEATAISEQGYGWYQSPGCYTAEQAAAWKTVTDAVHAKGSLIFMQLWHMGRQSHSSYHGGRLPVAPSAIAVGQGKTTGVDGQKYDYEVPRALETSEIPGVVEDYKKAATLAKSAGFDGVEVHAGNGYLLDTFLQSSTNKRTDEFGGSLENRYRLLDNVVSAVKTVYPADRVGVRISPQGIFGGMGSEDNFETFCYVAERLKEHDLAYLHILDGIDFGFHGKCPVVTAFDVKKRFGGGILANVGYTRDTAEGAIRSGAVDLVSFGRPFISNPDLPERFANNWPLAPDPDSETYYRGGAKGYIDWPTYTPPASK